jgi:CubicO group peptidase (beta-lactamase class C family)
VKQDILGEAARAQRTDSGPPALYSDLGYLLVGAALERIFSLDLDCLLAQEVFQPRGLRIGSARACHAHCARFSESVVPTEIQPPRGGLLRGVVHDDNAWALAGSASAGHAGLFGNLTSILRFGCQMLDLVEGREGAERQAQFLPLVGPREGGTLLMGFDGITAPGSLAGSHATMRTFGHLGFTGTSLWIDPGQQKVTALLCNRVYPTRLTAGLAWLRPKIHDFLWRY